MLVALYKLDQKKSVNIRVWKSYLTLSSVAFTYHVLKNVGQSIYPLHRKSKYFGWNPKWYVYSSCRFWKKMEIRMPLFSFQPTYLFTHHLSKQAPPPTPLPASSLFWRAFWDNWCVFSIETKWDRFITIGVFLGIYRTNLSQFQGLAWLLKSPLPR